MTDIFDKLTQVEFADETRLKGWLAYSFKHFLAQLELASKLAEFSLLSDFAATDISISDSFEVNSMALELLICRLTSGAQVLLLVRRVINKLATLKECRILTVRICLAVCLNGSHLSFQA